MEINCRLLSGIAGCTVASLREARFPFILLILSSLTITFHASAATWFVDISNSSGTEDGTSWATAFTTIQPAIDAAFGDGGGDVWVAQGTYNEVRASPFHAPPLDTGSLVMQSGVNLYGGFVGNETLLSQRDPVTNVTTIDGSTSRGGLPAYHVIIGTATSLIDGFTVIGGVASTSFLDPNDAKTGGGLFTNSGPMTLRNMTFNGNSAPSQVGGGVFSSQDLTVDACLFSNNTSSGGGGIFATGICTILNSTFIANSAGGFTFNGTTVTLTGCTFENNEASTGGGASITSVNSTISRCYFKGNRSTASGSGGGALRVGNSIGFPFETHTIINCIFFKNTSLVKGGAVSVIGVDAGGLTTTCNIQTSTFFGNVSQAGNGGAICIDIGDVTITNSIISGNSGADIKTITSPSSTTVEFSLVEGGHVGTGNIQGNPLFVNVNTGDLRVLSSSPAVDAGTLAGAPADDFNSDPRPQGSGVDMGAFENNPAVPIVGAATTAALLGAAFLLAAAGACSVRRIRQ